MEDLLTPKPKQAFDIKKATLNILKYIIFFAAVNILLGMFFGKYENSISLDGSRVTKIEYVKSIFITAVFSLPLLGIVLGSLLSLIPFKKQVYSKKILFFSAWLTLVLEVLMTILSVVSMFM